MLLRSAVAFLCLTTLLAGQTPVYVDARAGDDRNGQGTAASPFRTLTGAVAKTSGVLVPDFRLRPGTYDAALGATADGAGLATTNFIVPRTAVPVGTEVWLQALSLQPPHLGPNAARIVM